MARPIEHRGKREYKTFKNKSLATRWAGQREADMQKGMIASTNEAQRTALKGVTSVDNQIKVNPAR